ncbi:YihY/virulence factor BrkB family protein [Streptomyces tropicalis]|uniref:YihY/virulence factor BrkB family protein n=1 Tax=Streptomyces tropicalis TaxID=3034234 RepID=A0ABT6A455_9ACTN|nr:YihY/virulence factor BrkB family protein [Streptomyces tropicalis]MDF3299242.1 YihY/virulence factor BrkB family protein [Streptomyces tropicalis]
MSADSRPAAVPVPVPAHVTTSAPPRDRVPSRAATARAWWPALCRTPVSMWNDDITDYAAALTYYAILAVLPALLVAVLAFGLISPGTAEDFVANVTDYAPGQSGAELHEVLVRTLSRQSAAWTVLAAGGASALWSACSYLAVFRRALHRMHRIPDGRSPWRKAHRIVLTALVLLALLIVTALVLILSGPLAEGLGRLLHLDATVALLWNLLRWPVLLTLVAVLVVVVFHTGPVPARRRRHSVPGGVLAAALWLTVSAGFALYTSLLGTYSRLYGSLAGVVVFLIWLWLSNLSLLTGAQFTAELGKRPDPARRT